MKEVQKEKVVTSDNQNGKQITSEKNTTTVAVDRNLPDEKKEVVKTKTSNDGEKTKTKVTGK